MFYDGGTMKEIAYKLTDEDEKELNKILGRPFSAWTKLKKVVLPRYPEYLDALEKVVCTPKKKQNLNKIISNWKTNGCDKAYIKSSEFGKELFDVLIMTANQIGGADSRWNYNSALKEIKKRKIITGADGKKTTKQTKVIARSNLLRIAAVLSLTMDETRKLMFSVLPEEEQNDFNPRYLDEVIYLIALNKKFDAENPVFPFVEEKLAYAQKKYMGRLFGNDAESQKMNEDFLSFLSCHHIQNINVLHGDELHKTAMAYALYRTVFCKDNREGLTERFKESLEFYMNLVQKFCSIPEFIEKYSSRKMTLSRNQGYVKSDITGSEIVKYMQNKNNYSRLFELELRTLAIRMEKESNESSARIQTYKKLTEILRKLKNMSESLDLYKLFSFLMHENISREEAMVFSKCIKEDDIHELTELLERSKPLKYHPTTAPIFSEKQVACERFLLYFMQCMFRYIQANEAHSGDEIACVFCEYSHLLERVHNGIMQEIVQHRKAAQATDPYKLDVEIRGVNPIVQYHESAGTSTVEQLAYIIHDIPDSAEDEILDQMLEKVHIYEPMSPTISVSRYQAIQRLNEKSHFYDEEAGKLQITIPGFYDEQRFKGQYLYYEADYQPDDVEETASEDEISVAVREITRKDLLKLNFWCWVKGNYPSAVPRSKTAEFIRRFNQMAVETCVAEFSSHNPLDAFLQLCLQHQNPLAFIEAALASKPDLASIF